jgi:adenine-specific DNA-methyltransferase
LSLDNAEERKTAGEPVSGGEVTLPSPPESCTVYTPMPLAQAIAGALGDSPSYLWLEPCVGNGVFLQALSRLGVGKDRITAIDLDPVSKPEDALAATLRGIDFVAWSLVTRHRFDRIVANPPYIALSKLDPTLQKAALSVKTLDGESLNLGSNYWCAFMWSSLGLLRPGGDLGFVLPAAWDYADYAAPLRDYMIGKFARLEVHRSYKPLFDGVQDGCVVVIGRGFSGSCSGAVRYEYDSADSLVLALQVEQPQTGWISSLVAPTPPEASAVRVHQLKDILDIRLGGVTGDSEYFLLTERKRLRLGLPVGCLRPVVSKARHLVAGELTKTHWEELCNEGERVWLFDPPPELECHPAVESYLNLPVSSGGCQRERYKIRNRSPWYRTPLPEPIDGFMSGMTQYGPWICLRGMESLAATNTLYTVRFRSTLRDDERASWALSLLASEARRLLASVGRVYPSGLVKHEPGDLLELSLPVPRVRAGAKDCYLQAVKLLLAGEVIKCAEFVNGWLAHTS